MSYLLLLSYVAIRLFLSQLFLVMLVDSCHPAVHRNPAPETDAVQGRVRGTWFTTRGGRNVAAFLGIPYAAPPIGDLRFLITQRPEPWSRVFDATSEGPACIQRSVVAHVPLLPDTYGSENCLYLNVFSPKINSNAGLPVVIFIHGGYFEVGFSKTFLYGPQYLLDEDIILVTFNYRLGILGFLSLHDQVLPGNLGLKDQRMAFRWVRENIRYFGGDPQQVTLFGESAGAASVHYHMIFTAQEGLFRAGICNSGSALAPWALHTPSSQRPLVDVILSETGCPQDSPRLVQCLRDLPAEEFPRILHLVRESYSSNESRLQQQVTVVGPVVESESADDAIVIASPWNISWTSHLPLLTGVNQMESLYWLVDVEKDKTDKQFHELDENYSTILPFILQFNMFNCSSKEFSKKLKKFYFKDDKIKLKNFKSLIQLLSDGLFNHNVVESVKRNKHSNTFLYQMNYRGSNSVVHYFGMKGYGVSHFDEMFYLFPIGGPLIRNETEPDTSVSIELVKMWTNFIKYLNPTPDGFQVKWYPVIPRTTNFFDIGKHGFRMDSALLKSNMIFWNDLLQSCNTTICNNLTVDSYNKHK